MKTKLLTSIVLILSSAGFCKAQTQSLWGTTFTGGGGAVMYKINSDGSGYTDVYHFNYATGDNPYGNLIQASDGNIYATTENGGPSGSCVLFRYNVQTNTYTDVHDFYFNDGYIPYSGVVEANGKLFGVTWDGGLGSSGVIYAYDLVTGVYADVYDFNMSTGNFPWSVPMLGSDGKLYGITTQGGTTGGGVIYRFDPVTHVYTDLYNMNASVDGGYSYASLYEAADGKLYGTCNQGGAMTKGTIFSYDLLTNTFSKLYDFASSGGANPIGALTQGSNGMLYGTASDSGAYGGGSVFSFDPTTHQYNPLYHFNPSLTTDGATPKCNLMFGSNGLLYGTTFSGGVNNHGTIFNLDPSTHVLQTMSSFSSSIHMANGPNGGLSVIVAPTGINNVTENNHDLDLYPNPATDQLHISSDKMIDNAKFVLRNSLGQEILSWNETAVTQGYSKTIDVEKLDAGIYFLEMTTDKDKTVKKFIKN